MAQEKPAKNKAKTNQGKKRSVRGVMGLAAQTRQDNLNKALGDTGSGRVKRQKFGGKKK